MNAPPRLPVGTGGIPRREAMRILAVSDRTVYRLAESGRLPYIRTLGGHRRFDETQVRDLAAANYEPGPATGPAAGRVPYRLTPEKAAEIVGIRAKLLSAWAARGHVSSTRTPGGHRRFNETEVRALAAKRARPKEAGR